jgi:type II secretory pathway pseudopilin PulG
MNVPATRDLPRDAGMTLVELIMYVAISALFLGLLATMFVTNLTAGEQTRNRDTATGTAQVVAESLQTSIRNAALVRVDGPQLRAQVAKGTSQWECRAWALQSGELRYTASAAAIPVGSSTNAWTVLAKGVTGTQTAGSPFLLSSADTISIGYTVTVGEATVKITSAAMAQAKAEGTPPACW